MFKYITLGSGFGGFEYAMNTLGGQSVYALESDDVASQMYEKVFGKVHQNTLQEVSKFNIPQHDLMLAKLPSAAFAVAWRNKDKNNEGNKDLLSIIRIVKDSQPKAIIMESVVGLINVDEGKVLNTFLKELCEVGYFVDFNVLDAGTFGSTQNRKRLFINAVRKDLAEFSEASQLDKSVTRTISNARKKAEKEGVRFFKADWNSIAEDDENISNKPLLDYLVDTVEKRKFARKEFVEKFTPAPQNVRKQKSNLKFVGGIRQGIKWCTSNPVENNTSSVYGIGNRIYDARGQATFVPSQSVGGCGVTSSLYLMPVKKPKESKYDKYEVFNVEVNGVESNIFVPKIHKSDDETFKVTYQDVSNDYVLRSLTVEEGYYLQGYSKELYEVHKKLGISKTQMQKHIGDAPHPDCVRAAYEMIKGFL